MPRPCSLCQRFASALSGKHGVQHAVHTCAKRRALFFFLLIYTVRMPAIYVQFDAHHRAMRGHGFMHEPKGLTETPNEHRCCVMWCQTELNKNTCRPFMSFCATSPKSAALRQAAALSADTCTLHMCAHESASRQRAWLTENMFQGADMRIEGVLMPLTRPFWKRTEEKPIQWECLYKWRALYHFAVFSHF